MDAAVDHYREVAGELVALGFVDALQKGIGHICRHPGSGSTRYAVDLNLPGLRSWPLRRYPFILFYVEREANIDLWRILRADRDLPLWLRPPDA